MNWRRFIRVPKTFKRRPRFWFWFVAGGVSLFLLALMLLPLAIRWGAQRWLRRHGIETARVKAVEFNPFSGRLAIYSVFGVRPGDKRLNLGRGEVRIEWSPLFKRRLNISGFTLENVLIDVDQTSEGAVSIGGLKFNPNNAAQTPEPSGRPWEISVGAIDLHNVSLVYREPRLKGRVDIWDAHIDPIDSARPEMPTCFSLSGGLNGGNLNISGGMRPFNPDPLTTASLRIAHLPLAWLGGLVQAQQVAGLGGELDVKADLKFNRAARTGIVSVDSTSTVSLKNLRAKAPQGELGNVTLNWGGRVNVSGSNIKVAGAFGVADLKARLAAQGLDIAQSEIGWRGEIARDEKSIKAAGDIRSRKLEVNDLKHASRLLAWDEMAIESARIESGGTTSTAAPLKIDAGLRLKGLKANLAAQGMAVEQREFTWQGRVVAASRPAPDIQVQGNLSALGFTLDDLNASATLARVGSLSWRDAVVKIAGSTVKAGGQIHLSELKSRLAPQNIDFAQSKLSWAGDMVYDTSGSLKMTTNLTGDGIAIRDFKKQTRLLALDQFTLRDARLDADNLNSDPRVKFAGETHLTALRARLPEPKLSIRQDDLNWKGRVNVSSGKSAAFDHAGDLTIAGLTVEDRDNGLNVLDLDQLSVSDAKIKSPSNIEIKRIRIGPLRALERPSRRTAMTTQTHTLSLREFTLDNLSYDGKSMAADSMRSSGLACVLVRGADGALELQKWSRPPAAATESKPAPVSTAKETGAIQEPDRQLQMRIGRIELDGDNRVFIRDAAVNPPVHVIFRPINLSITGLDSSKPDNACPILLTTRAGKYANIKIEGTVAPFAASPTASLTSRIESIDLPVFTPYTQQYIGYRLASGTLSIATDLKLDRGVLKSTSDLSLHMFELERLSAKEMDMLSTQLGYPVNTALAMLRDGNGDIRLKIPIDGDLSNPQFGIMGVVRKAFVNGAANSIRSAVQLIYAPLGAVVSIGEKITGQGGVLKCNPVIFAPGKRDLASDANAYLDQVAATMRARPGLRLSLTGIGTAEDAAVLPAGGDADTTGTQTTAGAAPEAGGRIFWIFARQQKAGPPKPLPKDQLLRLGNRRASVVMDDLVRRAGIEPDRIFRRAAAIDETPGAKPRVEVSF